VNRGTGLKRGKPLTRRAGLNPGTGLAGRAPLARRPWVAKRNPATEIPDAVSDQLTIRSGGVCEPQIVGVCTQVATDRHHRMRRRDGGHAITNLLHCCRACHAWVHREPAASRVPGVGWIVSVFDDPATADVLVHQGAPDCRIVRLTADGAYA
jgi:hypothetical protein